MGFYSVLSSSTMTREPLKIIYYGAEDGNIYNLALLEFYYILIDDSFNDSVHGL